MVMAAAGGNANEDIMKFAANLTIDNEEYEQFNNGTPAPVKAAPKLPVHASTQDEAAKNNFDNAADRNSFEMLSMFGQGMERAAPGQ